MKLPEFFSQWILKYWRWFALAVVVIIFSLGYVTLLAGKISSIRTEILAERSKQEEQLLADEAYHQALQTSSDAFDRKISTTDKATLEEFIPTGSDFPTLVLTVKDIVERSNLQLKDLFVTEIGQTVAAGTSAPVATTAGGNAAQAATIEGVNLRTQDLEVNVEGIRSYDDVKNFVTVIESSRRLFDVVSLTIDLGRPANAEAAAATGNPMTLRLRTYYLPTLF